MTKNANSYTIKKDGIVIRHRRPLPVGRCSQAEIVKHSDVSDNPKYLERTFVTLLLDGGAIGADAPHPVSHQNDHRSCVLRIHTLAS